MECLDFAWGRNLKMVNEELYSIRLATCGDVEDIYAIKKQSFSKYLPYTIYQSPLSINYLRELIRQGTKTDTLFVICRGSEILGYYHGAFHGADFFLNYIAVRSDMRGQGLGEILLKHYESVARTYGCKWMVLDVFATNQNAWNWYLKHEYQPSACSFIVCLDLHALCDAGDLCLTWTSADWSAARQQESTRGFSKIEAVCGEGQLTIGLIADHICKLLHYEDISLELAVSAIAHKFRGKRDFLVVPSLSTVPLEWPILSSEKIVSLRKMV